jgi:hypothetical protein
VCRSSWTVLPITAICFFLQASGGQANDRVDPLFATDSVLKVRIAAQLDTIISDRPIDEYLRGDLSYHAENGDLIEFDIGIQARGNYRRRSDVCSFPPLRLNLKKSQTRETLFANQNKLKLVSHCATNSHILYQAVIAEFLAYRILNLLTEQSFRVRLLEIEYINTSDGKTFEGPGILIEHSSRLAERLGVSPLRIENTAVDNLDLHHLNLTSVFQYLIGNTDFSPISGPPGEDCCHNYKLFGDQGPPYLAVPYDFDMSGFVSAPYAVPNHTLRLDSVQDRLYRGWCVNNERLPTTFEKFQDLHGEIETLIEEQAGLSRRKRYELLKYVDSFYRTISRPKSVERYFINRCR